MLTTKPQFVRGIGRISNSIQQRCKSSRVNVAPRHILREVQWNTRQVSQSRHAGLRHISSTPSRSARYVRFSVDPKEPFNVRKWDTGTKIVMVAVTGSLVYYVAHLEKVPETGRWRFMDVNPRIEATLAKQAHAELLNEFKGKILPPNHQVTLY
ncbi:hypothetical protein BD410DRAFT_873099, partial [Rickenella mellea]